MRVLMHACIVHAYVRKCIYVCVCVLTTETQALADEAVQKVVVKYKDVKPPILTIEQALEANSVLPCFIPAVNVGSPEGQCCSAVIRQ